MNDEYFEPEHAEIRQNRQPLRGRGRGPRSRGSHNMSFNMRGANTGPPSQREFQSDEDRSHMEEKRSRFSIREEFQGDGDRSYMEEKRNRFSIREGFQGDGERSHMQDRRNRFSSREEFQGDGERSRMQDSRSRFSSREEPPFDEERSDFDGRVRYDNRAPDRHQHRMDMEGRSIKRMSSDRSFEQSGSRDDRGQAAYVTGRSRDKDENRNREVQEKSNENSAKELKLKAENQSKRKDSPPRGENIEIKSKSEKDPLKGSALCSVVLENIPVETTYKDIRKLFSGLELPKDGIKIINNNEGRRIGKAYIRFGSQESFKKGIMKDRSRIANKIIIIKPVPRKEFDTAIDSYLPPDDDDDGTPNIDMCNSLSATLRALKGEPVLKIQKKTTQPQNDFVVKITLLPEYTKIQNIKSYFKDDFEIAKKDDAIVIELNRFKACTGLCYVEFANEKSFNEALNLKRMFEKKAIKIEKGSKKEMTELRDKMKNSATLAKNTSHGSENSKNSDKEVPKKSESVINLKVGSDSKTGSALNIDQSKSSVKMSPACICLRVRNIPKSLKVFELRNFFESVGVHVKVAQICHDAVGRAIGEGYLEFSSNDEVQKCLVKNGTYLNKNKITVEPETKPEMIENMRLLRQSLQPEIPSTQAVFFFVKAENLPKNVSTGEIMNFFSGYNPAPESIRLNISENKDQPNCSTALVGFRAREQAETAIAAVDGNLLRGQTIKLTKVQS